VTRRDGAVVRHLLAVAAGLRSVVPGEPEILGQVRDAFLAAERERAAGPVLSALFRRALDAGRRIRTETTIARRPASVASAAVELAARDGGLDGKHVVVLGAGRMARAVCSSLLRHRGVTVTVAARRTARLDPRVRTAPFLLDASLLADADVVVAATSASEPVVDAATLAPVRRPLLVIDLGMPRNVDPAAAALCALRDLDDLHLVVADAVAARAAARRDAAALLERHAREFDAWRRGRAVRHELAVAREQAAAVRDAELARLVAAAGAVDAPTLSRLERTAARHAGRWLHEQVSLLKHAPAA